MKFPPKLSPKTQEAIILAIIIAAKCSFLAYIYFAAKTLAPRGDAWIHTYMIVSTVKNGFLNIPWKYPPLFIWIWSIPLYLIGLDSVQKVILYVIALSFINQALAIIFYYTMVKELYQSKNIALLSTLFWLFVSGFGWTYLITNHPQKPLTDEDFIIIIRKIAYLYGGYSGPLDSPTYTDGRALARLFSLALLFLGITLLNKALKTNKTKHHIQAATTYTMITAGHLVEAPAYALAATTLIALHKPNKKTLLKLTATAIISSTIALALIAYAYKYEYKPAHYLVCFSYPIGILAGIILKQIINTLQKISNKIKTYTLAKIGIIILIYLYGLSIIAFKILTTEKKLGIYYNYYPHWYTYPIEWGFTGLYALIALTIIVLLEQKPSFGLKFTTTYIILLILLVNTINIVNYHITFIMYPFPIQPVFILPFLATIAAHIILLYKNKKTRKILYLLLFLAFSLGTIDTLLSANYWRIKIGFIGYNINLGSPEQQILNYLLKTKPNTSKILTPYPWYHPLSYITTTAGYYVPSYAVIYIYWTTKNVEELKLIYSTYPVDYILLSTKYHIPQKGVLIKLLKNTTPILQNKYYSLYKFSIKTSKQKPLPDSFIRITEINFTGHIYIKLPNKTLSIKGNGKITPSNNNTITVTVNNNTIVIPVNQTEITIEGKTTLHNISSYRTFQLPSIIDDYAHIQGKFSFKTITSTGSHLYIENISLKGFIKFKQHYTYRTLQEKVKDYMHTRNISINETLSNKYAVTWTVLYVTLIHIATYTKRKHRAKIAVLYHVK